MSAFRKLVTGAVGVCATLATCALIFLMLLTVADVVKRALTDQSIAGAIELAPLVLLGAVALGLGNGELTGTHVRTTLVTDRLPARVRAAVRCVGYVGCIALLVWMTYLSFGRAIDAYEFNDTTAGFESIPTWPARALVPVGFGLWALVLVLRLVDDLTALRYGAQRPRSSESSLSDADGLGVAEEVRR